MSYNIIFIDYRIVYLYIIHLSIDIFIDNVYIYVSYFLYKIALVVLTVDDN